ncbi:MAG: hypothetical protein IKH14_05885 [Prevotella sp.]|nr:hypothetical protein [Prevotella sp.]
MRTAFIIMVIILIGLACAVNTEAATVKYAKNVGDFNYNHRYVLEAAEYPKSSTTKVDGWVATPNSTGWMDLKKYTASTAESKHQIWRIDNHEQQLIDGIFYPVTAPTYEIYNEDPLPYWSNDFMGRAITYTSKGFYRQSEIYGTFDPCYEHFSSPAQRWKIVKVRTDAKTGRAVFKFVNSKSGKALAAGGYAFFYVRIVE